MTFPEPAITIEALSKTYKLYNSRYDRMREFFHPFRKKYHRKHQVLKNISFQVNRGEVVGVIGKNGSGKSTLLKILNSVVTPTSGGFNCHGRVTALLELGGEFNQELTGIQNLYYLGAIQGFSRREMHEKIKQILDFANIGEYARQPVNTYSSGMYLRLAFSMAINIDPDILITDEVLAVGDVRFQQQCFRRIREFKDTGKTFIICTHSMNVIKDFCTRAIWLHEGVIIEDGDPLWVADRYTEFMLSQYNQQTGEELIAGVPVRSSVGPQFQLPQYLPGLAWASLEKCNSFGSLEAEITHATIVNRETGKNILKFTGGETIGILLHIFPTASLDHLYVQINLNGQLGNLVMKFRSNEYRGPFELSEGKPEILMVEFEFPHLGNGGCSLSFGIFQLNDYTEQMIHWVHDGLINEIANEDTKYKNGAQVVIKEAKIELITNPDNHAQDR